MVGHQFTPEQRNCMAMAYERNKENFKFMDIIKAVIRLISLPVDPIILDQKTDPPLKLNFRGGLSSGPS